LKTVRFNDILATLLEMSIMAFWGLQAYGVLQYVNGEVNGALLSVFILVAQFYFRKKPTEDAVENKSE
jgi:hypothetical protein